MWAVGTDVVSVSVCLSVGYSSEPCKTAEPEPIEMSYGEHVGPMNCVLDDDAHWRHLVNTMA